MTTAYAAFRAGRITEAEYEAEESQYTAREAAIELEADVLEGDLLDALDDGFNRVRTFADAGLMTNDRGVVVTLPNGSEFQVSIVRSANPDDRARTTACESCAVAGVDRPATTHSTNPDWSGYDLCDECAAEYDQRPPIA